MMHAMRKENEVLLRWCKQSPNDQNKDFGGTNFSLILPVYLKATCYMISQGVWNFTQIRIYEKNKHLIPCVGFYTHGQFFFISYYQFL